LWDPSTGERRGELADSDSLSTQRATLPTAPPVGEHGLAVNAVVFSPDGATLAAACSDGMIRIWNFLSGDSRLNFSGHAGAVRRLAFAPDDRTLTSLGDDSMINLWHLGTGQQLFTLANRADRLGGLAFSYDGCRLMAGLKSRDASNPSSLLLWRAERARP
jgi:WD40 repeat protein